MLRYLTKTIFIIAVCLVESVAFADEKNITFGTILFPPGANIEPGTGKCIGRNIEKTQQIFLQLGIELNVLCTSPIRIYRMIENNQVDLTINIKSTAALEPYVAFTKIPYTQIVLNLYHHKNIQTIRSISSVRGFDYNGNRSFYAAQGVEFLDLPNTISAIQVFVRERSDALLSYRAPMDYYLQLKGIDLGEKVESETLLTLDSYYAVNKRSPHFKRLITLLDALAEEEGLKYYRDFKAFK